MQKYLNSQHAQYLKNLSIDGFNDMQNEVIARAENSENIMLLAPTGSGKTLAFVIPLLSALDPNINEIQAIIVTPSRELAIQIETVIKSLKSSFRTSCCYGGHSVKIEQNSLKENPAIVIGTPGRLADHMFRDSFNAKTVRMVVLDEFDKSLQLGFLEQIKTLFKAMSGKQRHILTSATKMKKLPDFLPFTTPEMINYLKDEEKSKLKLKLIHTSSEEKADTLMRLAASFNNELCLVFCNHRDAVERISTLLGHNNYRHGILHGGMEQIDREKNLISFRSSAHNLLIATDLASRGLDIPEIKHIIHYQTPPKEEAFLHRNGRTARMHADGKAYLILSNDETLPDYIDKDVEKITLPEKWELPAPPDYVLLYISAGKKDKISKGDIVGLLTKKCGLAGDDIGLITTLDFSSYVSVKQEVVDTVLSKSKNEKVKKLKVKIEVAR